MIATLSFVMKGFSQTVTYNETFTGGSSYASGSSQWDNWTSFRNALDTTSNKFARVTISGTYDATGRTCADPTLTRRIATNLRNNTASSITCNGFTWNVGGCGAGPEFNVGGTICACNNGYSVRPQIGSGNTNWGGVNSTTCGGPTQYIKIEFINPKINDAGVTSLTNFDLCTTPQAIFAKVYNFGNKRLDSFRLHHTINGVVQPIKYLKTRIAPFVDTTITLITSQAFVGGTNYQFKAWTSRPNGASIDSVANNDTSTTLRQTFVGNPNLPTTTNTSQCGTGRAALSCTPANSSDSINWWTAATGGLLLGSGKNILGPVISGNRTFWAEAVRGGGRNLTYRANSGGTTAISFNTTQYNGAYFNLTPATTLRLDSLSVNLWQNISTGLQVYYRVGSFVGNQTNSGAWTLLTSAVARNYTRSGALYGAIKADVNLNAGQVYGFYITTNPTVGGNDFYLSNGANTVSNGDMSFIGGTCTNGLFGTQYATWTLNVDVIYKKGCTNPTRVAQTVTVKPRPTGASVIKGATFQGQFKQGSPAQPDITEVGKTIIYDISPPTGYTNANYNSTWFFNSVTARTKAGVLVPNTAYTVNNPSGSSNGTITFTPTSTYLDSTITFTTRFQDLGPYFCDSSVARTVHIAPTPVVNFNFPMPTCFGTDIPFNNLSSIHSGSLTYMWYFGDGDSSDFNNPTYLYKTDGVFNVRLVAKSFPYNVIKDTVIQVEVTEVPVANFKVNNACQGSALSFANLSFANNGVLTYSWNFGDNSPASLLRNPTKLYAAPGSYKVTLTASANGCTNSITKNAYQFAKPLAAFTAPTAPICAKAKVVLPNTSSISLGEFGQKWTFGDGEVFTEETGTHFYSAPNTYSVKLLVVSEFGCSDSITKSVVIKPTPAPNFTYNKLCSGLPTEFTNTTVETVANPIYTWTISDGFTSNTRSLTKNWTSQGNYTATLKALFSNACEASITKDLEVTIQPDADFTVADICSGEVAKFVNLTKGPKGFIKTNWNFGNGTSTDFAPTRLFNPNATQTYNVQLVASYDGACSDTVVKSLTVSQSPTCDFNAKFKGFLTYDFIPTNNTYTKYEWFYGEGGSSTLTSPTYKYDYDGNFSVKMMATNAAGCKCEITKKVNATAQVGLNAINSNNKISIYPNPNNGSFTINSQTNGMKIEVFNIIGEKVLTQSTLENSSIVNLGDKAKGIYLVKVTVAGVTSTTKVTVAN